MINSRTPGLSLKVRAAVCAALFAGMGAASADDGGTRLPTGQLITPKAASGAVFTKLNPGLAEYPSFTANGAIKTAVSPDGKTLLVLTSGYNLLTTPAGATDQANQFIFVYNIAGANEFNPALTQVLQIPDSYVGLVWSPDGTKFYVSGGTGVSQAIYPGGPSFPQHDSVYAFSQTAPGTWARSATIDLGHPLPALTNPLFGLILNGVGFEESSTVAGLGLSADGSVLVAANIYNDSISVIDTATNTVRFEYDLRPYNTSGTPGVAGGETPFTAVVKGNTVAYVSSIRDREVVVVNIAGTAPSLVKRIALPGNPNSMLLSADQSTLYVTQDNSDTVAVIDTATNTVLEQISTIAPPGVVPSGTKYTGAAANNLALSPNGKRLFVTNGGANSVAVIDLSGAAPHSVIGLVPTGWYPNSVSVSADGRVMYIANGKSDPGANPGNGLVNGANQYVLQLEGASLLTVPVPERGDLNELTATVAANNGYSTTLSAEDTATMAFLRQHIQHVIYIVKENRTFDQVLGDLGNGSNGNPALTMYGSAVTPNFHALASQFVTLDNFYCSGEVSGNGWAWSTEGRESDHGTKTIQLNYSGRGASNDSEGSNRDVNVGVSTFGRDTALGGNNLYYFVGGGVPGSPSTIKGGFLNLLPGTNNDFATDGPNGNVQTGYLWDSALRAGLSVRNYGFFVDISRYNLPTKQGGLVPSDLLKLGVPVQAPAAIGLKVAYSTNPSLQNYTDPFFWGFDNAYPDAWRLQEWQREFAAQVSGNNMPNLTLLRLMHDHTGNFGGSDPAVGGLTTPELQQADNDYAVGQVVQTIANSPYAGNTLIFVLEDDAQDGPDHVDAHRSTAYVVGPYVKQGAVVSKRYSTVNMVRTIEDVLGIDHLNLNDAYQGPMTRVFDVNQSKWTYTGTQSAFLNGTVGTLLNLPDAARFAKVPALKPAHSASWWAAKTRSFDWSDADRIAGQTGDADAYNRIEWEGVKPGVPYPKHVAIKAEALEGPAPKLTGDHSATAKVDAVATSDAM